MEQFETIDIDNNPCKFQYLVENGDELEPDKVHFKIFSIPKDPMRWFSYTFKIIDGDIAKGEMMTNNGYKEFAKKGIPEKVIEIASSVLARKIISSPTNPQAGDYLVGPSYKAWGRLVENNVNAYLNENKGYFELNMDTNQ